MSGAIRRENSPKSMRLLLASAMLALVLPSVVAAEQPTTVAIASPGAEPGQPFEPSPGVPAVLCAKLGDASDRSFDGADKPAVVAFYQGRQCRPVWIGEQGLTHTAMLLIGELGRSADWGLNASDFTLKTIGNANAEGNLTVEQSAAAELELTAAALRYAHQAEGSRIPDPTSQLSFYLGRKPAITPASDVLARLMIDPHPDQVLRSFQPPQEQFLRLKTLLASLRGGPGDSATRFAIARQGPMLMQGLRHPDVAVLKQRFGITSEPGAEALFDEALGNAVKRFQASNGLYQDGTVGSSTRAALAGPGEKEAVSDKIQAVIANMEEWRWMPRPLGPAHILVNIPSFTIELTNDGETVFEERVVVGLPDKPTPVFSKNMTSIVLRPRWNIPDSIKLSMLLSGRSIERQGYVVMRNGHTIDSSRVNWSKADLSAYTFYQPAGDDNALGLVKLLFPNQYSVYLHDTPAKELFNEPVRLYSHGCMRVRNPQDFAQHVVDIDRGDTAPDVKQLIRKGPMDNEITLDHPIPVHVGYFTVWVDDDGEAQYYKDWYGHQKRITLALAGKWDHIAVEKEPAVDTSALKQVRFTRSADRSNSSANSPMGLTNGSSTSASYRRYDGSVGDMIRQVLGF